MKTQKAVSAKVGKTFPGVTEDQIQSLDTNKVEEIPEPMMTVGPVNELGILEVEFNQEMLYPETIDDFDYSKILAIKFISSTTGRITKSSNTGQRELLECPERSINSYNQSELAKYYLELEYDEFDILAACEFEQKRFQRKVDSQEDQQEEKKVVQSVFWKVVRHNALKIAIQIEFSQPDQVSTGLDRDKVVIEFTDLTLFKSKVTGKGVSLQSFSGRPEF